jgi:hypothetical protein
VRCADSGNAVGEEDGEAVDDRIMAAAAVAAYEVYIQLERAAADRTRKPAEVCLAEDGLGSVGLMGHVVKGTRFEVRVSRAGYHGSRDEESSTSTERD